MSAHGALPVHVSALLGAAQAAEMLSTDDRCVRISVEARSIWVRGEAVANSGAVRAQLEVDWAYFAENPMIVATAVGSVNGTLTQRKEAADAKPR